MLPAMSSSVAKTAAGAVTGVGAVVGAFFSPLLQVAGVFVLVALGLAVLVVAAVVLTAALTPDPLRHERSIAVLEELPHLWWGTPAPTAPPPDSVAAPPTPPPRWRRWRRRIGRPGP
jgi:hypothetical protein